MNNEQLTRRLLKFCIPSSLLAVLILSLTLSSVVNLDDSGASFTLRDVTAPLPRGIGHISAEKVILPGPGSDAALRLVNVLVSIDLDKSDEHSPAPGQAGTAGQRGRRVLKDLAQHWTPREVSIDGLQVLVRRGTRHHRLELHSARVNLDEKIGESFPFQAEVFDTPSSSWELGGQIQKRESGWKLQDATLVRGGIARDGAGLSFDASIWAPEPSTMLVDLNIQPVNCEDLLAFAPEAWRRPFSTLTMQGRVAPWVEIALRGGIEDVRLGGFASDKRGCTVTELVWNPPEGTPVANVKKEETIEWLKSDFVLPVVEGLPEGVSVNVGPGLESYISLDALPPHVAAAFYLSEDHDFYQNAGISQTLLSLAMTRNLRRRGLVAGGSTLTQQLVKNLFLTRERSLERKFQEALLALHIGQVIPKERVLELYINCIELGPAVYGVEAAAQHYFGVSAERLTPTQSAFLAALTPWPKSGEQARRAGATASVPGLDGSIESIVKGMHRRGYIEEFNAAPIVFAGGS